MMKQESPRVIEGTRSKGIYDVQWRYPVTMHPKEGDDLICSCNDYLRITKTAYGARARCRRCEIRWTLLWTETEWEAEEDRRAEHPQHR